MTWAAVPVVKLPIAVIVLNKLLFSGSIQPVPIDVLKLVSKDAELTVTTQRSGRPCCWKTLVRDVNPSYVAVSVVDESSVNTRSCEGMVPPNTGWTVNAVIATISAGNIFRVDLDIIFLFLGMRRNSPPVRAFWAAMSILIIPGFLGGLTGIQHSKSYLMAMVAGTVWNQ